VIRTALTISIDPAIAMHTSYIINGAYLGYLAPNNQKNHVQTSNRALQLIAAFTSDPSAPGATAKQREKLIQWQLLTRELQQHKSQDMNRLLQQYQIFPDLVVCLDESWLRVWLGRDTGLFLMRNQVLHKLEPVDPHAAGLPTEWTERLSYYALKIEPEDYYLFMQPDIFSAFSAGEAVSILAGLRQLPSKMSELLHTARDRHGNVNETWLAMNILRLEPDAQHPVPLADHVGKTWEGWRSAFGVDSHHPAEELQSSGRIIDRAPGLDGDDEFNRPDGEIYRLNNESPELAKRRRHRWLGLLLVVIVLLVGGLLVSRWLKPGALFNPQPSTVITTTSQTPTTTTLPLATPTPKAVKPTVTPKATPSPKPTAAPVTRKTMTVRTSRINVRKSPNQTSALVAYLYKNATLTALGKPVNGWYKVELKDGRTGYAWAAYLK
jgi:hypothetical protein